MYKARPKAKLRRQGWAGATADTEGATWTPHAAPHLATPIPALHPRPKQALPEPPRHCTSWLALGSSGSLCWTRATALSRDCPVPLATARAAAGRPAGLPPAVCCHHAHGLCQRISFLLRS